MAWSRRPFPADTRPSQPPPLASGDPHQFSEMSLSLTTLVKLGLKALPEFKSFSIVGGKQGAEKRYFAISVPPLLWPPFPPSPPHFRAAPPKQSSGKSNSLESAWSPLGLSGTSGRTCGGPRLKGGSHHCEVGLSHCDLRPCHRGAAAPLPRRCPGGTL